MSFLEEKPNTILTRYSSLNHSTATIGTIYDVNFFFAAESGNLQMVRDLLAQDVNVNFCDHEENSALHLAAKKGFHEIVRLLIFAGADGNLTNSSQKTALQLAEESLEKVNHELKTAQNFQKILKISQETLSEIKKDCANFAETTSILKSQQLASQITATAVFSQAKQGQLAGL